MTSPTKSPRRDDGVETEGDISLVRALMANTEAARQEHKEMWERIRVKSDFPRLSEERDNATAQRASHKSSQKH